MADCTFPRQPPIKTNSQRHTHREIWSKQFFNWGSLFLGDSRLFYVVSNWQEIIHGTPCCASWQTSSWECAQRRLRWAPSMPASPLVCGTSVISCTKTVSQLARHLPPCLKHYPFLMHTGSNRFHLARTKHFRWSHSQGILEVQPPTSTELGMC